MPNHRKPKSLKIIHGTFRADRNPKNEPTPDIPLEIPKPPTHLGKHGKKLWKSLSVRLHKESLLTVLDVEALEILCEAYDQYRAAHYAVYNTMDATGARKKRSLGEYLATHSFQTMTEYSAMNKHFDFYRRMLTEFGMTPVSRNRIDLAGEKETAVDPMEELVNGG